jgi:hypothetical protein
MNPRILNTTNTLFDLIAIVYSIHSYDPSVVPLIAPALTAFLYLAVILRFLLPWPFSSPNSGGTVELGGAALGIALGISERLGRGCSGVQMISGLAAEEMMEEFVRSS